MKTYFYSHYLNQPYGSHQREDFYKILTNILDEISISVNIISNILYNKRFFFDNPNY